MPNRRALLIAGLAGLGLAPSLRAWAASDDRGGVLVFGGTGKLGSEIVKLLVAAGEDVTVFARASSNRDLLAGLKVDYAIGDLTDAASVAAAFDAKRFDTVIDASATREPAAAQDAGASRAEVPRGGPERDSKGFYEATMRIMAAEAKRTGVKHFILHGSVLAGDNIDLFPQFAFLKGSPTMLDKGRAEKILIDSGVPYTIIRHGRVPGGPQPPATGHAYLSTDQTIFGDMTRADLAILTLDCLHNPARMNKIYHATDPTYKMDRPLPSGPMRSN
ncbi:MAG: NAD(P)H-binding protein [Rhodospirillaceae bacterium]|nr:NAD(P)H-binding protein [Rhodospirillaceae bacterium]